MHIADQEGIPRPVAARLMFEESGDPQTGSRGNPKAYNKEPSGYQSQGLFQLHTKPSNIEELKRLDWMAHGETEPFDIWNPLHNAKVAMRYLARKHRDLGTWYRAVCYYNSGKTKQSDITDRTKAYAMRIISAKDPEL
ncbi:MAG: transglycosylase SLT domain-containing protein [Patescibacteria group bacterium]